MKRMNRKRQDHAAAENAPAPALDYTTDDAPSLRPRTRSALILAYALLIGLPYALLLFVAYLPIAALLAAFVAYAFALLPTYYLDHWLFGGRGFHSPATFALFALIIAAALWPLPLLAIAPRVWRSRRGRRIIRGYALLFALFIIATGWWMTRRWNLFFG